MRARLLLVPLLVILGSSALATAQQAGGDPDQATLNASDVKKYFAPGLVGPSDELWNEGAGVLATAHLDTMQVSGGATRGDISALAAHVRELAVRAVKVSDIDERAQLYGELLSTCAGCHQIVRPTPVK